MQDQGEIILVAGDLTFADWERGWYYCRLLHAVDLHNWKRPKIIAAHGQTRAVKTLIY
jgi:hypothetical protein